MFCKRPKGDDPEATSCPDPKKTDNPVLVNWNNATDFAAPKVLDERVRKSQTKFKKICPFIPGTEPLCCSND
jgi:hypothetical protein